MADAIEILKKEGATVVDADIPSVIDQDPKNNFLLWGGGCERARRDPNCSSVLWYGMKRDFNAWLASLGPGGAGQDAGGAARVQHRARQPQRDQVRAGQSRSVGCARSREGSRQVAGRSRQGHPPRRHRTASTRRSRRTSSTRCVFPGPSSAGIAAKPGYPTVIVPFGLFVPAPPPAGPAPSPTGAPAPPANPYPAGFTLQPAPYGVSFTGTACSEPRLIELAYAFEQATKRRVPPPSAP